MPEMAVALKPLSWAQNSAGPERKVIRLLKRPLAEMLAREMGHSIAWRCAKSDSLGKLKKSAVKFDDSTYVGAHAVARLPHAFRE